MALAATLVFDANAGNTFVRNVMFQGRIPILCPHVGLGRVDLGRTKAERAEGLRKAERGWLGWGFVHYNLDKHCHFYPVPRIVS